MKLEEILKARGWTDEELKAQEALLANPKFRMALEEEYGVVSKKATEAEAALQAEKDTWAKWHQETAIPVIDQYQKDAVEAKAEAAAMKARYDEAVKQGYVPAVAQPAANPNPAPAAADPAQFDPRKHGVATIEDLGKLAATEGDVITMEGDLAEEYHALTGQRLFDYQTTTGDGRTLRGRAALRYEAGQKRIGTPQQFYDFVANKFDFAGKRKADADKRQKEHDDAIRADERSKAAAEYGNPNLRMPMPSRFPFIPPKPKTDGQPWEQTSSQMRERRLSRAWDTEVKSRAQ